MTGRSKGTIRKQLMGWFLTVGLLPLILVAAVSYQQASTSLQQVARTELSHSAEEKIRFINNWFDYRWMDLALQANNPSNGTLLQALITGFINSGESLADFTQSPAWENLVHGGQQDLAYILATYDYMYDLFLIDNSGNILLTVAKESDLGTNLFTGPLKHTRFAYAVAQALEHNRPTFSDFERYRPSGNLLSGFLAAPLRDKAGLIQGAFAIQIRIDRITRLLTNNNSETINQYLVGRDSLLRSQYTGQASEVLAMKIETAIFEAWLSSLQATDSGAPLSPSEVHYYLNPMGEQVIGRFSTISIGDVDWVLISEVEQKTTLAPTLWLVQFDTLVLLLSATLIAVCAAYLARRIANPITKLNQAVEGFSKNNNPSPVKIKTNNEIGNLASNFNHMMAARERYENRLKDSEKATLAVLKELKEQQTALSHHAIVAITDIRGTIIYVNQKFEEVSGYRAAELLGNNHRMLNSGYHPQSFFRDMYLTISQGGIWNAEICNRAKDGHLYWVATTIAPLRDKQGNIDRYIAIRTDINGQKSVQHELRLAKEAAEAAAKAKSEFLATMSHEIRTPMNGVLGMLGLLMRTKLSADQQHQARLAMSSAESLLVVINDILDFTKIEAGRLDIEHIDFDLNAMLGDFSESIAPKANEKGLELILDGVGIEHSMVLGDPGRLRQIITNLVNNAIKFTEQGEIVIRAALHTIDDHNYRLDCSVCDTGIGIPADRIDHIFDSFTQVDASTTRRFGGTGLGLAIVKQLCQLMGGDIEVSSKEGEGSCFHFHIRLEPSQLSCTVVPSADVNNVPMLIVDDNATNREVLRRQLELWGAKVDQADNGEQALAMMTAKLQQHDEPHYAVVFLDMQMPDMDGADLGERIRSRTVFNATKLIMMTSIGNRGDANRLARIGFNGYFPKPTTMSDLLNALAVLMEDGTALAQAKPLVTHHYLKSITIENPASQHWPQHCRLLLVEDNPINQSVVQGMLEEFNLHCEMANQGHEAIELLQNAERKFPYTLILMDCQMPIMDGYEATRQIRAGIAGKRYQDITVIAMTANAMSGDREKCLEAGMNDYMSKPINIEELHTQLQIWLNGVHPESFSPENPDSELAEAIEIWKQEEALKRVRNRMERLNTLIDMFLQGSPQLVQDIRQNLSQQDYAAATHAAHTLKGVAANLSVQRLTKAAERLEHRLRDGKTDHLNELVEDIIRQHDIITQRFRLYLQQGTDLADITPATKRNASP